LSNIIYISPILTETPFELGSKGWIYSPSLAFDGLPLFLAQELVFWVPVA